MLLAFLSAVGSILTIVIMFMTGWCMTHAGWLNDKTSETFSKIVLNVAMPCYMIWNLMSNFDRAKLKELSSGLIVPILSIGLTYVLAIVVSNVMKVRKGRKGIFRSVFFTSNTIFIGLPVNLALFGEKSTPYVLLYYIANTIFFWTFANYEISKDGENAEHVPVFSLESLKRILNPALDGFILAVIFILMGVHLPKFVMDSCKYIGSLTTPLAMFFVGIVLHSVHLKDVHFDRDIIVLLLARFLICPMTIYLFEQFIYLPPLMTKVFVIQSAMPAVTSTGIVAKRYGADCEFATLVTVITTIFSMIAIPIYMVLI